jgi:hypothetical protein
MSNYSVRNSMIKITPAAKGGSFVALVYYLSQPSPQFFWQVIISMVPWRGAEQV